MRSAHLARGIFLALAICGVASYGADFRAGAGKSEIQTSQEMWPLEGYTSVHDQASVRVLIMDDGGSRFAIVSIETPSAAGGVINAAKAVLTKVAGVPADNAIVYTTHSTSAPHISIGGPEGGPGGPGGQAGARGPGGPGGPGAPGGGGGGPGSQNPAGAAAYAKAYQAAVEAAVQQAAGSMQPARVGFGVGVTDVAVSRDMPTPKGWAQGSNSAGYTDRSLPVVRIEGANGKPIAVIMDVSVRPVVVDASKDGKDGGKALSADLSGAASRYVEQWYGGGTVAIYLMGAAVDQAPVLMANRTELNPDGSLSQIDIGAAGFTVMDLLGERLGADAIQTSESIKATAQPTMEVLRKTLKVPSQGHVATTTGPNSGPVLSYTYADKGTDVDLPVVIMRIGDIAIPGIQPELASRIGAEIKAKSPYANTMMLVMADGNAKYMVDSESFEHFTAEARGSSFARGAAEQMATDIDGLLKQMKSTAGK